MTRFRVSVWVIAAAFLAAACGGVQAPDSRDSAAATQKVAGRGLAAGRQAAGAPPTIVNPAEELKQFAPDGVLRWTEVPGADAYEVWAYTDYGASQLVETSAALTSRQYQCDGLV